jgi:hypothetical protein
VGEKKGTVFPKQEVNAVIKIQLLKAVKHSLEAGGKLAPRIHAAKKPRSNKLVASAVANATILPAILNYLPLARHAIAGQHTSRTTRRSAICKVKRRKARG